MKDGNDKLEEELLLLEAEAAQQQREASEAPTDADEVTRTLQLHQDHALRRRQEEETIKQH